jgi:hypothetical protein
MERWAITVRSFLSQKIFFGLLSCSIIACFYFFDLPLAQSGEESKLIAKSGHTQISAMQSSKSHIQDSGTPQTDKVNKAPAAKSPSNEVIQGLVQYTDPQHRFLFDYPAKMKLDATNPDEIKIYHPDASLRITVFVQKRQAKSKPDADSLLEAFKKNLKEQSKDVGFMEQGKLQSLSGAQGYLICSFKNAKGTNLVQLVQYYVSTDKLLQMTISDKPQGFKNLLPLIRKIHESLRIVNPAL